ncbi:MAG TPA: 16S rRNA (uracil(1498)-N(3))-methyltransferase [Rickettsiales bacterium]|nr:16S rRNA (uracil(1498)-N(3))-methyltransferase [Rickettsiales bacterium]
MSPCTQSCPRLYVEDPLTGGASLALGEKQSHYLVNVMRLKEGDGVTLFNGQDGEWSTIVEHASKKRVELLLREQLRPQSPSPDLWLIAAPLKTGKSEKVLEQATELGISGFIPVTTRYTVVHRMNHERLSAIAIEASEQCERLDVPQVRELTPLTNLLGGWDPARKLIYGDESGAGKQAKELFPALGSGKYAVLIGPEGGFSAEELALLASLDYAYALCMGPRIMRADTAAIAAVTLAQSWLGDWKAKPAFRSQG